MKVSVVQPGGIISDIGDKSRPDIIKRLETVDESFKEEAQRLLEGFKAPQIPPTKMNLNLLPDASGMMMGFQFIIFSSWILNLDRSSDY